MELKFLFGTVRVIKKNDEDTIENATLKDCILMTRKTDLIQHSEMASATSLFPLTGGFIKSIRDRRKMHWFGESVSCRVRTDESMEPLYTKLVTTENYWKAELIRLGRTYTIFMVCPVDYEPSCQLSELKWRPCSHLDLKDIVEAEQKTNVY